MLLRFALILSLGCLAALTVAGAQNPPRPLRVAVLDFGDTETGRRRARDMASHLSKFERMQIVDESQARAAARGVGYNGSLNMTVDEARDLGAAIDCDYFITGDAQTVRRTSSAMPVYYEAYVSVFIVHARTGRLAAWERPHAEAATPEEAEVALAEKLARRASEYRASILRAEEDAQMRRERELASEVLVMEDVPEEDSPAAAGFRAPHPYRRVRPPYPDTASEAEAEATVDVSVEIDERGTVRGAEVVRWGGFGLDDAVLATVRALAFRPATRDGRPVPVRILLRYNFRRPPRPDERVVREGEKKLGPAFKAILKKELPTP